MSSNVKRKGSRNYKIDETKRSFPGFSKCFTIFRFMSFVVPTTNDKCWKWQGKCNKDGYGLFRYKRCRTASVVAYLLFVGKITTKHGKKSEVCHTCDNPSCVNPNHLWLGTHKQNMEDMVNKGRRRPPSRWAKGEQNGHAKLTESQVLEICSLINKGRSDAELAKRFSVTPASIWQIRTGRSWSYITKVKPRRKHAKETSKESHKEKEIKLSSHSSRSTSSSKKDGSHKEKESRHKRNKRRHHRR